MQLKELTFENLRWQYGTGRSYTISGTGRDRVCGYRSGVQTKLGDIEVSEWMQLMRELIEKSGEQEILSALIEWESEHNYCRRKKSEVECYALELHSSRIFENPEWVDFIPFNKRYRPDALIGVEMVDVFPACCKQWGTVTQARLTWDRKIWGQRVTCPICGRLAEYSMDGQTPETIPVEVQQLVVLPTAEEIGIASVEALKLVSQILLKYGLKYRPYDFQYVSADGTTYNRDSVNLISHLPYYNDGWQLGVTLSYKCKQMGKKLKALVKENADFLAESGAQQRYDGIVLYLPIRDLTGELQMVRV